MATTGVVNSKILRIKIGSNFITCLTDATFDITNDTRSTTCKDSGQWAEAEYAQTHWEISGSGLINYGATQGAKELITLALAQTISTVSYKTGVSGDPVYTGDVLWTKMSESSPGQNESATFSFSGMGTGAITVS